MIHGPEPPLSAARVRESAAVAAAVALALLATPALLALACAAAVAATTAGWLAAMPVAAVAT